MVDIERSTFSGNLSDYRGGELFNSGRVTVANSTMAGNMADTLGSEPGATRRRGRSDVPSSGRGGIEARDWSAGTASLQLLDGLIAVQADQPAIDDTLLPSAPSKLLRRLGSISR